MKNKSLLIILSLFLFSSSIKAQYLGAQLGTSYLIGLKPMVSIGLHFNTILFDQNFEFGANYHLPIKYTGTDYAQDITGSGGQITIAYTEKLSMFDLHVLYRYYFSDNSITDGGLYIFGGGTVGIGHSAITPGTYDKAKYRLSTFFDEPNTNYFQPYFTLGLGWDKVLENDHILGFQFLLNLNGNTFNSRSGVSGDATMPSFVGLRAMYSIPLGN